MLSNLIGGDDCCYLYGSVPHNDSNCVPQGGQLTHRCTVYNPRDEFTNLSVRWLRVRTEVIRGAVPWPTEMVTYIQGAYELYEYRPPTNLSRTCTHGVLYGDTFALNIYNFTTHDNGYYWCQIVVNDSYLQPSQYAWFYADSCKNHTGIYFQNTNEAQCANATYPTIFPPVMTSPSFPTTTTTYTNKLTTMTSMDSLTTEPNIVPIFYIVGILSVLTLSLGTLTIVLLSMLVRKRQIQHKKRNGEPIVYQPYVIMIIINFFFFFFLSTISLNQKMEKLQ